MDRIPVTVLTGYLGAGKTTLLNRILSEDHGRKYAVIVNEFGEIGIDNDLIVDSDEEVFEMNNGCICCTVRGDLIRVIAGLMKRKDKFDQILIETTGLADPAPVAQTFFADEDVQKKAALDSIVTVVDAKHFLARLADSKEAEEQVAFADVILLNKTDLVPPADLAAVEQEIRAINPVATIHRTSRCAIDLGLVLDQGAFDLNRILEIEPEFLSSCAHGDDPDHVHDEHCGHDHHDHDHHHHHDGHGHHDHAPARNPRHDDAVTSISLATERLLDENKFNFWINRLLQEDGANLLRTKGILAFKGRNDRFVFQAVHMISEGDATRAWREGEARRSRIVFIGRHLTRDRLQQEFEACIAA